MPECTITVKHYHSEYDDCVCCPGKHVFMVTMLVDDEAARQPRNLEDWLRTVLPTYQMEGKRVRIVAEIIEP